MVTNEAIVQYFEELGLKFKQLEPGMWMVQDASGAVGNIVVRHEDPIVVFRVKLVDLPENVGHEQLYRELLELNATEMVHGAFALEGSAVVAVDALQSETLDKGELQGSIDSLSLAVTTHQPRLARYVSAA